MGERGEEAREPEEVEAEEGLVNNSVWNMSDRSVKSL